MALNSSSPDQAQLIHSRHLIETGRALLAAKPPLKPEDAARLEELLNELETALKNIDGHLILGLLGGTGVGKSTLISALAGQNISASSAIRPTTSQPVIFHHHSAPPLTLIGGRVVEHQSEALRHLTIVDFPDFDSLETAHHQLVLDNFKALDLAVWVTDYHKYGDRRFFEIMAKVQTVMAPEAQVILVNKCDDLTALGDGGQAQEAVVNGLTSHLADFGHWRGGAPWPIAAAEALAEPLNHSAGGLGPLRDLLASLANAKLRRALEIGNLKAKNDNFLLELQKAATPEGWLQNLENLTSLQRNFRPQGAVEADLTTLLLTRSSYLQPRQERLKKTATGLLALFTDGWDFALGRLKGTPDLQPPAPLPSAPATCHYLAGRSEDFSLITGLTPAFQLKDVERETASLIQKALNHHLKDPRVSSALLYLWPLALAPLLIWAETSGQYGGPAALTMAFLRSAAPWILFSLVGDLILSRFIWFRARRRYEGAFHRALDEAQKSLLDVTHQRLGAPLDQAVAHLTRCLDLLSDLTNCDE